MQAFHRSMWLLFAAVAAGFVIQFVASAAAADPPRKILKKEERLPQSGFLIKTAEYYLDADGKEVEHGIVTFFNFPGGFKSQVITMVDGQMEGPNIRYNSAGAVIMRGQSTGGLYDGKWEWLHSNGKTHSIKHYDRGRMVGTVRLWTEQGALEREEEFKGGQKMKETKYYANGAKQSVGTFVPLADPLEYDTVKSGTWTYWRPDGKVVAEGVWKDGKPFSGVCQSGFKSSPVFRLTFARYDQGKVIEQVETQLEIPAAVQPVD